MHEEGLASLRKFIDVRTDNLVLAEIVLKNNIFQLNEKTLKQFRGTAIGTKFTIWMTLREDFRRQ